MELAQTLRLLGLWERGDRGTPGLMRSQNTTPTHVQWSHLLGHRLFGTSGSWVMGHQPVDSLAQLVLSLGDNGGLGLPEQPVASKIRTIQK